jgi:hypothetical protein
MLKGPLTLTVSEELPDSVHPEFSEMHAILPSKRQARALSPLGEIFNPFYCLNKVDS